MLRIVNLRSSIGRIEILKGVSLRVREGEIVTLIGANGAGKSTILNTIAGLIPTRSGQILFCEREIGRVPPEKIVRLGIALVPEGRQLFAPMTVMDNLTLGAYQKRRRADRTQVDQVIKEIFDLFPILKERAGQLAGTLSGGEQQMLAIGRALMSCPKLMLLDECSLGLAPLVVDEIMKAIGQLRDRGITFLLVEQNARKALSIADRGYVIETGHIIAEGECKDLLNNPDIGRAYLGKDYVEVWE